MCCQYRLYSVQGTQLKIVTFSEKDILREEITSLEVVREKLRLRVSELEEEVRRVREELAQQRNASQPTEEDEVSVLDWQRVNQCIVSCNLKQVEQC